MSSDECDDCADYCYRTDVAEQEARELREQIANLRAQNKELRELAYSACGDCCPCSDKNAEEEVMCRLASIMPEEYMDYEHAPPQEQGE